MFLLLSANLVFAQRDLLQTAENKAALASSLVQSDQWIKYPAYADCLAWDQVSGLNYPHYLFVLTKHWRQLSMQLEKIYNSLTFGLSSFPSINNPKLVLM